ncbi:MAG: Gfo/Idh/MocA family protein, partial [Pirellulaceae bacterium]
MSFTQPTSASTRRQFLRQGAAATAGTALLSAWVPHVHAADTEAIRLALIGCGPRGTGAVNDALSVEGQGPVELYALADLTDQAMTRAYETLRQKFPDKVNVSPDRRFQGFDAYRAAIDLLRPGDIAMCTTRAYIRPVHVEYAVSKGIHVFMEKPFASDPGGLQRLLKAGEAAEKRNVKIAAGLQCRHSPARQALIEQIRAGELGEIHLIRANRLGGASILG